MWTFLNDAVVKLALIYLIFWLLKEHEFHLPDRSGKSAWPPERSMRAA